MLSFEKALEVVLSSACQTCPERSRRIDTESVDIAYAAHRILAEDIKSGIDMPPFDKSAMDGFACRRADLASELTIVETIPAGYVPRKTVGPNQCAKIMTGGHVPTGADCVIMKEYVETPDPAKCRIRFIGEKTADNICKKGEDVKAGECVLIAGTQLKPQHIAVLASVGCTQPLVAKRPRVAVIATGNELVEPLLEPGPAQIRNSNSFQLAAQVESVGALPTNYGIARDTAVEIDGILQKAIDENDVVLVSGGVSVGDFDIVPQILRQNNISLLFDKIAIKPGKPTVFGTSETRASQSSKVYCFGLPGNPVSTFVVFEILVKPFLYKLMGHDYRARNVQMPLAECIRNKKTKRQRWLPVAITRTGAVKPLQYHGSAHISSLCGADGLIRIDVGVAEIEEGTVVPVRLI